MQKDQSKKDCRSDSLRQLPNFTKPVWGQTEMSCSVCKYNDQDVDTFPCAKCHTRH